MTTTNFWPASFRVILLCGLIAALGVSFASAESADGNLPFWGRHGRARQRLESMLSKRQIQVPYKGANATHASCEAVAPEVRAAKKNVWAPMTDIETATVVEWLFKQSELNLTASGGPPSGGGNFSNPLNFTSPPLNGSFPGFSSDWANTILHVELMRPNKSDALAYLEGNGTEPRRYAHVTLANRATEEPHIANILVGPLPVSNTTKWAPLNYPFNGSNGGKTRQLAPDMGTLYNSWMIPICQSISDITKDLWGATCSGPPLNGTKGIIPLPIEPLWQDDGKVTAWHMFRGQPTGPLGSYTLMPLGLYVKSDVTARDPKKWKLEGWFYNGVFYENTKAFKKAYWSPGFEKIRGGEEGDWGKTDRQGEPLPLDENLPPAASASGKPRFAVDVGQRYVEWMGFSFYMGFSRDTGLALFDIAYEGERIFYELSLQEALAHYAGNDPAMSGTAYLDSFYGFGANSFELVQGFDCPQYATYLNSTFYLSETTHTHLNSICLFEFDADYALQRHSAGEWVSATKNTQFTVRHVATVGNYDYTVSYTFSLDGSVEASVRASGYIETAFAAHNEDYGFRLRDTVNGAMHDHVINFKADIDVLGTANSVQLVRMEPVTKTFPWSGGRARSTMQLRRSFIESEDDGRLDWDSATQLLVVNKERRNRQGEYRAWRVQPLTPPARLTVAGSSDLGRAAGWTASDVAVTRAKDSEPRSASAYNGQDVADPLVDFSRFLDSEPLDQADLVVWVNAGMHHVPHSGDLPNTVATQAHAGVRFSPSNYFDGDVSRRSRSMVRVSYRPGHVVGVDTAGRAQVCENSLWDYKGDVSVVKYPFDPDNPFYDSSWEFGK